MQTTDAMYEVSLQKTHSMVKIEPALTDAEWEQIERAGDDILSQINGGRNNSHKAAPLLFDLSSLEYMGSSMVAMIVRCWKATSPKKGHFVVVAGNNVVRQVLELSGLSQMWTIVDTPEEGLRTLGISPKRAAQPAATGPSSPDGWSAGLAVAGVLAAVAGIGLWFAQPDQQVQATGLIYGGAGVGFVMGLVTMLRAHSQLRFLGLGAVLLSVGMSVFRLMQQ